MSTPSRPYIYTESLRQRYSDELDRALRSARLSANECVWLKALIHPGLANDQDPVRVDRLVAGNVLHQHVELSGALLLSHDLIEVSEIYLYTLGEGLEVYADRSSLLAQLRARYASGDAAALFEYEQIDGDPFEAQMLAIFDHQAERVAALTAQLRQTPMSQYALTASTTEPVGQLWQRYNAELAAFWITPAGGRTPRDLAIEAFESSVRDRAYRLEAGGVITAESRQALFCVMKLLPGQGRIDSHLRCYRLAVRVGDSASCALAGTFMVKPMAGAQGTLLWYSPDHQWHRFANTVALTAYLVSPQGRTQLASALALPERYVLQRKGEVRIGYAELQSRPCATLVDSIIAMQARNLVYARGLSQPPEKQAAMIDDALDIRQLLDPRQLQFSAGRWRQQAPFDFMSVWQRPDPRVQPSSAMPAQTGGSAVPAAVAEAHAIGSGPSWRELTRDFDQRTEQLRKLDNALQVYAEQTLERYLCVWSEERLAASQVNVKWQAPSALGDLAPEPQSLDLTSLLLERVTGRCLPGLPDGTQVQVRDAKATGHLPVALIEHILLNVTPGFIEGYVHQFQASRRQGQRHGDHLLYPEQQAISLREDAMRLYASLAARQNWIDDAAADLIRQMLDQPTRALRMSTHPESAEAFKIRLTFGDTLSVLLCDAMVLQGPQPQTRALVFWSSLTGWRSFESGPLLQRMLQRKLAGPARNDWLHLLSEGDRRRLERQLERTPGNLLRIQLEPIHGHALEVLQEDVSQRELQDVRELCLRARRCRFDAQAFSDLAAQCEIDTSLCSLTDGLSVKVETTLFEALLPPWLSDATLADLRLYCDLLKQYYVSTDKGNDFLFGISTLNEYASKQLLARLSADFPGQNFRPDDIKITSRDFVSAFPPIGELPSGVPAATVESTESLTEYAINRFASHQGAVLSVTSQEHPHIATTMTVDYVRRLIRDLDVGAGYAVLLRQALTPTDAQYALRNRLFVDQLPPLLLTVAMGLKLKGELSQAAFDLLAGVLDMPDGLAREPINGVRATISPVRLVADAGMTPDPVTGVYLFCGEGKPEGPHVMYAMHHSTFTFREYASRSALQHAIRTDETVQTLLLARVEPSVHRRYDHGGFVEPHLPFSVEGLGDLPLHRPGPVTLDIEPLKGNAAQYLFEGAVKLLLNLSVSSVVTNDQEDQAGRAFLVTLGFEQLVSLLPSKLSAMVTLWQSQNLLRASAASASGRHWGEAFSEFSAALGVMVTAREQTLQEHSPEQPGPDGEVNDDGLAERKPPLSSPFSWRNTALDAGQKLRLQGLEAQGVALNDMRHDRLLNLFTDTVDGQVYAVVSGRVYRVRRIEADNSWMIVGADGSTGPKLIMDVNQHWRLDLNLRLRGGGAVVTKIKEGRVDKNAEDILVIEARGMPKIRKLYRDRARRIGQAHLRAQEYLETCLDNLSPHQHGQALDVQVTRILTDHFGISAPDKPLLDEVLETAKTLHSSLMDASLSPFSSQRFVVGSTRPGHEMVTAFVIKADPKQRLYLTEQFFASPRFAITPAAKAQGFSVDVHHRAATLIHELSHLALDTYDIAYLESMAPFPDLLLSDTALNTRVRDGIELLHTTQLSHLSNRNALFTVADTGVSRDIEPEDGRGFEAILKITDSRDLDDARDVFLSDAEVRSRLIMRNADSVTLLMLLLGRRSYLVPSP